MAGSPVGSHTSSDYTGVWHFIDVAAGEGRYNDIRGLWYEGAGPAGKYPGVIDVGIMVSANMSGLSVNAYESDGDDFYGEYDKIGRGDLAWHAYNIAHTEFSSVANLAHYGWDQFKSGGRVSARGLAWPLHAIADASCPHHTVGTTSWGHRPYEDWIERIFPLIVEQNDKAQRVRILYDAFYWWDAFQQDEDMEAMVTTVAFGTKSIVESAFPPDWPYQDLASFDYHTGAKGLAVSYYALAGKDQEAARLMEHAIGATLGLLLRVSQIAVDPGADPSTKCPTGTRTCIDDTGIHPAHPARPRGVSAVGRPLRSGRRRSNALSRAVG